MRRSGKTPVMKIQIAHMLLGLGLLSGCGNYVTHEELQSAVHGEMRKQLSIDVSDQQQRDVSDRQRHQEQIATLEKQATTGPTAGERGSAALAAAQLATDELTRTLDAIDAAIAVTVENMSNANTNGFRAKTVSFGADGKTLEPALDLTQGQPQTTRNPLDIAIIGNGFFAIKTPDGLGYTRNGSFFINKDYQLTLGIGDGYRVIPAITIPNGANEISIRQDGTVEFLPQGGTKKQVAGQFQLTQFANPQRLKYLSGSIYVESPTSGSKIISRPGEVNAGTLISGFLEESNVDLNRERAKLHYLYQWRNAILQAITVTSGRN
jgi:flagellar basal body rod protein FlgG